MHTQSAGLGFELAMYQCTNFFLLLFLSLPHANRALKPKTVVAAMSAAQSCADVETREGMANCRTDRKVNNNDKRVCSSFQAGWMHDTILQGHRLYTQSSARAKTVYMQTSQSVHSLILDRELVQPDPSLVLTQFFKDLAVQDYTALNK